MSNKSRLQTNNTNLQALINKANNLPDAGSGGSDGGSVETCAVTILLDSPLAVENPSCTVYYTNGSNTVQNYILDNPIFGSSFTIEIAKNTIIYSPDMSLAYREGQQPEEIALNVFFITGDVTFITM